MIDEPVTWEMIAKAAQLLKEMQADDLWVFKANRYAIMAARRNTRANRILRRYAR